MKKLGLLLLFVVIGNLFSQEDTLKSQHYKEIVIQGERIKQDEDGKNKLQSSTETLLNTLPQVTLIKRGNYALEPTIRGLNAGQINMTIDGMQMFGACTDKMDVISSYIEPTNLEGIELSTTPDSKQTGSSIGGGLNFRLMKAQLNASKKVSGSVGAGYQTNANYFQTLGKFQYSEKRWAILVNGIYRNADNYHAAGRKEILFSQFEKWNVGANLALALNEKNRIYVDYIQDEGYNIGYPALTMDVGYAKAYISSLTHRYENISSLVRSIETKVFFNYIDHTMDDSPRPKEMVPIRMDMPGTSRTFGAFSKAKLRLKKNHLLSVKVNVYQNDLHAEMTMYPDVGSDMFMLTIPDGRRRVAGLTISDKWALRENVSVDYGGRIEYNISDITTETGRQTMTSFYSKDPEKTKFTGNIFANVNYKTFKNLDLFAGVSYGQRVASLQELYGFYLFNRVDNYDYIGNPDLKNETSFNANIGGNLRLEKLAIKAEGFLYSFSDYIAGFVVPEYSNMAPGATGVKQFQNIPSALLTGAEFSVRYIPTKGLLLESVNSYTYGIDSDNNYLPYIPPFKSVNAVEYNLKGYVFRLEHVGAASQNNVSTERYGENTTPGFNILNAYLHKRFDLNKNRGLIFETGAENIFDSPYFEHLDVMKIQRQGINFIFRVTFLF